MTRATLLGAVIERGSAHLDIPEAKLARRNGPAGHELVADRDRALLRVPGVADFAVTGGDRVVVAAAAGSDPLAVDAYMFGTVTALLLGQRGHFALHATLVSVAGTAVALAGRRGVGKTTTSLHLVQRGHQLLGDDVVPIELSADGVAHRPTSRPTHVTPAAAERLGLDISRASSVGLPVGKLVLPRAPGSAVLAGPLGAVVVLRAGELPAVSSERLDGHVALAALHAQVYRAPIVRALWPAEAFAWAVAVAQAIPVHVVRRPSIGWTIDAVAQAVERVAASAAADGRRHGSAAGDRRRRRSEGEHEPS